VENNPSILACGKQPKHPCLWKTTQASLLVENNPSILACLHNVFKTTL